MLYKMSKILLADPLKLMIFLRNFILTTLEFGEFLLVAFWLGDSPEIFFIFLREKLKNSH